MTLHILFCIIALLTVCAAIIICAPLIARFDFHYIAEKPSGSMQLSFLHPLMVSITADFTNGVTVVRIFGIAIRNNIILSQTAQLPNIHPEKSPNKTNSFSSESSTENVSAGAHTFSTTSYSAEKKPVPEIKNNSEDLDTLQDPASSSTETPSYHSTSKETVVPNVKKWDNWFRQLHQNKYLFFIRNSVWRKKILGALLRFLNSLLHLVRFDELHIFLKAGVENPMITGILAGYLNAASYTFSNNGNLFFHFEPVFMTNHFEGSVHLRARTSIFTVIFPVLTMLCTLPYLHTARIWFRYRKMVKKQMHPVTA